MKIFEDYPYSFKELKSKVFKLAHFLKKTNKLTFSEALIQSWKAFKLRHLMHQGVVDFSFIKNDQSLRETRGTLRNLPNNLFKGSNKFIYDYGTFRYWDLECNDFRAFSIKNLVNIDN